MLKSDILRALGTRNPQYLLKLISRSKRLDNKVVSDSPRDVLCNEKIFTRRNQDTV